MAGDNQMARAAPRRLRSAICVAISHPGHIFQQDRELIAPQTRQRVAFPQSAVQALRDREQETSPA